MVKEFLAAPARPTRLHPDGRAHPAHPDGTWLAIWQIDTHVDDAEAFMTRYMQFIEQVLTTEPIDIFAWPTFLPVPIARQYHELWTRPRIDRILSLCANPPKGSRKKIAIR